MIRKYIFCQNLNEAFDEKTTIERKLVGNIVSLWDKGKSWEIRKTDRIVQRGDIVVLRVLCTR